MDRKKIVFRANRGFSLRELFVVFLVVGILAVIAIPAYIKAQVRTKLVTVMGDNRAIHNAIARYNVEYNSFPVGVHENPSAIRQINSQFANAQYASSYPQIVKQEQRNSGWRLIVLTTPIAYLGILPSDPFQIDHPILQHKYIYYCPKLHRKQIRLMPGIMKADYETISTGPDRTLDPGYNSPDYDITNGVFSTGDIHYYGPDFKLSNDSYMAR
jgi:Tfp pilus assembly protein PilE